MSINQHTHIINKQIIELAVSDKATAFATQEKVSQLYADKLVPELSRLLDVYFNADTNTHYQIDTLTIDLGAIDLGVMQDTFAKELDTVLTSIQETTQVTKTKVTSVDENEDVAERTPLRVLAHYIATGRLPWWSTSQHKSYLQQQWESLMQNPTAEFKILLSELHHNKVHLDRYLHTFSEEQLLQSAQLITGMSENELLYIKNSIANTVNKSSITTVSSSWKNTFLRTVFSPQSDQGIPIQHYYIQKILKTLRLKVDNKQSRPQHQEIKKIRSFIQQYKRMRLEDRVWQEFFKQLDTVIQMNTAVAVPVHLLRQMVVLLEDIQNAIKSNLKARLLQDTKEQKNLISKTLTPKAEIAKQSIPAVDRLSNTKLQSQFEDTAFLEDLENATKSIKSNLKTGLLQDAKEQDTLISEVLTPIATLGTTIEKIAKQHTPAADRLNITKLQSQFEDADFITIENAGLVLFWPFLQRFFDNLGLLEDKNFRDQISIHKAVCALQYLCNPEESELFEGQLPLPKILCGVPLGASIPPIFLTEEEKEIANGLLNAVLRQGPHWKNLSITGFRTSYVCRQASFRTRDDHWLLQVQKETYDITLQKLPWSIQAVKLPWMERALMVDWM
ncbi:contractile injection system tape measure protein [uncultured Aquimarina sp.]|uniref:contractile injection system tape measure protein n=1 Tax=uncultured Aquimarina sp. TaxID=575652 RepID=UPI002635BE58|nr:contractile injection system tape measure protein [uncultured Aquimarina sp.]